MSKKVLIIGGVVLALVFVLVIGAVAFIMPPSAKKTCEHAFDLTKAYTEEILGAEAIADKSEEDLYGQTLDECIESESETGDRGLLQVKEDRKCVLDAEKFEDLLEC